MNRQSYYQPGKDRASQVRSLFDAIACRYDVINDLQSLGLHRWWKHRLLTLADVRPGQRALDLCCGSGDVARALAQRSARVIGLDFSAPIVPVAQSRDRAAPNPVGWVQADALAIPAAAETFDVVTISYGLRNLASIPAGLQEMLRVLKPGGRLLVLDFGRPPNRCWRALYFGYLRFGVPWWGRCLAGDAAAYSYILESLRYYPAQSGIQALLESLGGRDVRVFNLLGGVMSLHRALKCRP